MEQELNKLLQGANYRKKADAIVKLVQEHPLLMKNLVDYFLSGDVRLCQSASWPIGLLGEKNPKLIKPYIKKFVLILNAPKNIPAVNRNILRIFQTVDVPTNLKSQLLDKCFEAINNPKQPIAVVAFGITVACKICNTYPELQNELKLNLNQLIDKPQSPAVKFRIIIALKNL